MEPVPMTGDFPISSAHWRYRSQARLFRL